ncbi:hypothetical protein L7F22_050372 [Adiantum nelumboides]|nr:hypothetical protein [Adiantum nelumboides]
MAIRDQHPDTAQDKKAKRDKRLDTAQRIIEQVLQKEADTQSTFFNLKNLSQTRKCTLIKEVAETFLTPVVKVMRNRGLFRVGRSRTLSKLSSAYKKIVNKEIMSDVTSVQVQGMWKEQKNQVVWEEEEEEEEEEGKEAEEEEEQVAVSNDDGDRFCESWRLIIGENLDFCYLRMTCNIPVVEGIEMTVESRVLVRYSDYTASVPIRYSDYTATWGELAVLASDGQT